MNIIIHNKLLPAGGKHSDQHILYYTDINTHTQ